MKEDEKEARDEMKGRLKYKSGIPETKLRRLMIEIELRK